MPSLWGIKYEDIYCPVLTTEKSRRDNKWLFLSSSLLQEQKTLTILCSHKKKKKSQKFMVSLNGDNHFKSSSITAKLVLKGTGNFCLGAKSYRELKVKQSINATLTVGLADRLIWLPAAWHFHLTFISHFWIRKRRFKNCLSEDLGFNELRISA